MKTAPPELRVTVMERHIRNGTRRDAARCPIAYACIDSGLDRAQVHPVDPIIHSGHKEESLEIQWLEEDGHRQMAWVPGYPTVFAQAFDAGEDVYPFSFWI